jgi:hypothetical protein
MNAMFVDFEQQVSQQFTDGQITQPKTTTLHQNTIGKFSIAISSTVNADPVKDCVPRLVASM